MGLLFAPDSRAANGKAARIQAKPAPNPNPARMRPELASFDDLPMRSCFHGERDLSCARTAAQQPKAVFFRTCPAPRRTPFLPPSALWKTPSNFAPALIAPMPVKPCDGAVFGALNSLIKNEAKHTRIRNAHCAARNKSSPPRQPPGRLAKCHNARTRAGSQTLIRELQTARQPAFRPSRNPAQTRFFRQLARALLFSRRTRLGLHPERSAAAGAFFRTCPAPRRTPFWPPPALWKTPSILLLL